MKRTLTILTTLSLALAGLTACGGAQTTAASGPATAKLPAKATCPVSGEVFTPTADTKTVAHKGKTYYMCCPGCEKKFAAAPEKYLTASASGKAAGGKKDCAGGCAGKDGKPCGDCANPAVAKAAAAPAAAAPAAALPAEATCPVSGKKFKPTADTKTVMHDGKTYYMCCPGCAGKFAANPQQFIAAK